MNQYFEIIKSDLIKEKLENYLNHYISNIKWESDTYIFNGVSVTPLRKTYMFGKDYRYSGQIKKGHPFDEQTIEIQKYLEIFLNLKENSLNSCLCNLYENGSASISMHTDDEKEMPLNSSIIVLSLGQKRKFEFETLDKTKQKEKISLEIDNGDILIMKSGCQKYYRHGIPKEKNITETRVSLTFRTFK
jgi:alkylated DNA repair dioxygenase AlkB